jgi:hypothetical protein
MKALDRFAHVLRSKSATEVRQIATGAKEHPAFRACAWRELKWRGINQPAEPIFITSGMRPDGTLIVHEFATKAEAAAGGFPWAG